MFLTKILETWEAYESNYDLITEQKIERPLNGLIKLCHILHGVVNLLS